MGDFRFKITFVLHSQDSTVFTPDKKQRCCKFWGTYKYVCANHMVCSFILEWSLFSVYMIPHNEISYENENFIQIEFRNDYGKLFISVSCKQILYREIYFIGDRMNSFSNDSHSRIMRTAPYTRGSHSITSIIDNI